MSELEKLQRRAARIVMRPGNKSHVRKLVENCLSNRCTQFFMDFFNCNRDILPRRTRSSDKL